MNRYTACLLGVSLWFAACGGPSPCEERCNQADVCMARRSASCEVECEGTLNQLEAYSSQCRYAVEEAMECLNNRLLNCVAVFELIDCSGARTAAIDICGNAGRDQAREALEIGQ